MINLKIILPILLLLIFITPVFATDYVVFEAGTSEVNGTFVETTRTYNGKPVYENGEFRLGYRNCVAKWVIVDGDDDSYIQEGYCPLYKNENNTSTVPVSGWLVGDEGYSPAPSVVENTELIYYSSYIFYESVNNDGTIETSITITCSNYNSLTFTGSDGDNFVNDGKILVSNLPAGLTAVITRVDSLELSATLSGTATSHTNANDVSNLTFAFQNTAFSNGDASVVSNSTQSTLQVNFREAYTVASSGGDYSTIANAISSVNSDDILNLAAETFTEAGLTIDKNLIIIGQGASSTIIQAHATQGSASDNVFTIDNDLSVTMKNLTIRHGVGQSTNGGGIYSMAHYLTIENCVICDNSVVGRYYYGGGIYAKGILTITNSTISGNENTSSTACYGGGIFSNGTVIISNSTITGNSCASTAAENSYGGGLRSANGTFQVSNSTISGNTCVGAGSNQGGAISIEGWDCDFTITDCTIKDNSSGIFCYFGQLTISNTIIADNGTNDYYSYNSVTLNDNGYNIVENQANSGASDWYFDQSTDILYSHDYLGNEEGSWNKNDASISGSLNLSSTLADNNTIYDTQTLALSLGSFAIDNGTGSGTDQRGVPVYNGSKDIGAYEFSDNWVTWLGGTSSVWETTSNWNGGSVPASSDNIGISRGCSYYPSISSTVTCNSLNITENSNLTIEESGILTVSSELINNGTLLIKSGSDSTGMLLNNSAGIEATVQQYLEKDQWHYMGIPFSESFEVVRIFKGLYVLGNHEETATDGAETDWDYLTTGDSIFPLTGYGIQHTGVDTTISLVGTLNAGEQTINLSYTGASYGWNFVSNPYPATINWESGSITKTSLNDAIYLWNPDLNSGTGAYGSYGSYISGDSTNSQSRFIPPMQGFFVRANAASPVLTFTDDAKISKAVAFKSTGVTTKIRLALTCNDINYDEMLLRVKSNSTMGFDRNYDAYKLVASTSEQPQLYSVIDDIKYSINSIPEITDDLFIPIEMLVKTTGKHKLVLKELENDLNNYPIYIFKTNGELLTNLKEQDYIFDVNAGEVLNIVLGFALSTDILDVMKADNIKLSVNGDILKIENVNNRKTKLRINDINGRIIYNKTIQEDHSVQIKQSGVYIIRIQLPGGNIHNEKIVI